MQEIFSLVSAQSAVSCIELNSASLLMHLYQQSTGKTLERKSVNNHFTNHQPFFTPIHILINGMFCIGRVVRLLCFVACLVALFVVAGVSRQWAVDRVENFTESLNYTTLVAEVLGSPEKPAVSKHPVVK
jgi:hypothetical protein